MAQDERSGSEMVDDCPFMLRISKHSEPFPASLLALGGRLFPTAAESGEESAAFQFAQQRLIDEAFRVGALCRGRLLRE